MPQYYLNINCKSKDLQAEFILFTNTERLHLLWQTIAVRIENKAQL